MNAGRLVGVAVAALPVLSLLLTGLGVLAADAVRILRRRTGGRP